MLSLTLPDTLDPIELVHCGMLLQIDSDRDGMFSLSDVQNFAASLVNRDPVKFQTEATFKLWSFLQSQGRDDFITWLSAITYENQPVRHFESDPETPYIRSDTVKALYELFNIRRTHNIEL